MKKFNKALFLFSAAFASAASLGQVVSFTVKADRPDCLYRCGESASFTVTAVGADGGVVSNGLVSAVLDNFGPQVQSREEVDLATGNPFTVTGRLSEPGFLRLHLTGKDCKDQSFSVGYEPLRLEKGSPSPEDFDAFWSEARAPCAVYSAYNEIKVEDKAIVHGIGMTHACSPEFYQELGAWLTRER